MRQTAGRLNRSWLIVLGVVLLLLGTAGLLIGTGAAASLLASSGLPVAAPGREQTLIGGGAGPALGRTWVVVLVALAGVVVGLLGLAWLVAQVPRANPAKPFRLYDDVRSGLTRIDPGVLVQAVEDQTRRLPGVSAAAAVVRGTTQRPELVLRVTADDRTDLPALLARLQDQVSADLGQALDTQVARLGVVLDVHPAKGR